ncbi:hypothetical protein ABZ714_11415 [Streptomyces sp. NPDC006798]|uniref:hypothetical protein n=1 Tax=Streptomyces sp. NPDC006798 TaxID=3155462 RepID=UPI0034095A26
MTESGSGRLERLLFLRQVQLQDLARTDRWIGEERRRVAEAELAGEPESPEGGPGWVVFTPERVADAPQLHAVGCEVRLPAERTRRIGQGELTRLAALGAIICSACEPLRDLQLHR